MCDKMTAKKVCLTYCACAKRVLYYIQLLKQLNITDMKNKDIIQKYIGYSLILAVALLFCFLFANAINETHKDYIQCLEDARPTIQCEIERTL